MINILRYTEYLYLVVAGLSIYKVVSLWQEDRQGTYIFIFFAVVSLGMFFFRRKYRKKFQQQKRDKE